MIRIFVVVCPLALLGVWGYSYLAACFQTLAAPGKPFEFRYLSKEGPLTLRVDSFVFTLEAGHLRANGISLRDPAGELLGHADYVVASGLDITQLGKKAAVVDVNNLYGKLELLPSGLPKLLDYLPEPSEEPSVLPFAIRSKNVTLDVVEASGKLTTLTTPAASVEGVGDQWVAKAAPIQLSGQGILHAEARQDAGGLEVKAELTGAQLYPFLKFYSKTKSGLEIKPLQDLSAERVAGSGFVLLRVQKGRSPELLANVSLTGENLRYGNDYRADAASFTGTLSDQGARGIAEAQMRGADLHFNGAINWTKNTRLAGDVRLRSAGPASLPAWIRKQLPKGLSYAGGTFDGWMSYASGGEFRADGRLAASQARYQKETVRNASLVVHVDESKVAGRVERLVWQGRPLSGAGEYGLKSEKLTAALDAKSVPLKQVAKQFNVDTVAGNADVRLLIGGTLKKPVASLQARGTATVSIRKGRNIRLGGFNLLASLAGDVARVERLSIEGPNGVLSASGIVNIKSKQMALSVLSSGIPMQRVADDVRGTLAMTASIGGTFSKPMVTGRAEIYNGSFQQRQIPAVFADLSLTGDRLVASNVQAMVEGSQASGTVAYNTKTDKLDGRLEARLFLRDVLGEAAAGAADVVVSDIGGTLSNPSATAKVNVGKSFLADVEVDEATATAKIGKSGVELSAFKAKLGEGTVSGSGVYNFDTKSGSFAGSALAIPIERLTVSVADTAKLEGVIDVSRISAAVGANGLRGLTATGMVRNLEVNDTLFDGGPWDVTSADHIWKGSATLGVLERYIQVSDFTYNDQTRVLDADFSALDLDLKPLVAVARPYLQPPKPDQTIKPIAQLSPEAMQKVESLAGLVSAAVSVSGPIENLSITEGILTAREISVGDKLAGDLNASFTQANDKWEIKQFVFAGPVGRMEVTGTIEEQGQTDLDGELKNLDINWLSVIDPDFAAVRGSADLSFLVSGPSKRPNITGTLDARLLEEEIKPTDPAAPTAEKTFVPTLIFSVPFTLTNQPTANDPDAYLLKAEGNLNYKVLKGELLAEAPFDSLFKPSETKPWFATVTASPRLVTADQLKEYVPSVDPDKTHLKASGELKAQGTGKNYSISGALALWKDENALPGSSAITFRGADTGFLTLDANARLSDAGLKVTVDADGTNGGSLQGDVSLGLGKVEELLTALLNGNTEPLFNQPLNGSVNFSDFGIRERQIVQVIDGEAGSAVARLNGTVLVGQNLGTPLFSTPEGQPLLIAGGNFVLPTIPEEQAGGLALRVVPQFDMDVSLSDPAKLRAGNTNLTVVGGGTIGGSLLVPNIDAEMTVMEGLVRLPTARVRLEEGGSLHLQYRAQPDGESVSRLEVDLEGNTSVTALRFGSVVERYSVHLRMTGDLLSDVPINIDATSDPADLSSEQILRLLGQADVLEGLSASVKTSLGDVGVRTALGTFGVPALFDPITEQLATQLGLDYLSLEYNALEQATITAAKTLGKGLTLQFRRQLFEPPSGEKLRYDLRLIYRLPTRNSLLSRVTFSAGIDQDRPYKLAVEYGTRF